MHDPTTPDRQGNDAGSQYRSAIFPSRDGQRRAAKEAIERVNRSGKWDGPVVTRIEPGARFHAALEYHQDYLVKHPNGYSCHFLRD